MLSSDSPPPPSTAASLGAPPPPMAAQAEKRESAKKAPINPRLLELASRGDCDMLDDILNMVVTPTPATLSSCPDGIKGGSASNDGSNTTMATQQASSSFSAAAAAGEEGACHPVQPCSKPVHGVDLEGVTIEGDTALHVVAACGDGAGYLRSAGIIYRKAPSLLSIQNNKGDTPLHCSARAGKVQMVSRLIDLAKAEDTNPDCSSTLKKFLRKENCRHETALHDAVRIGNKEIITKLLEFDPELASFPMDGTGTSPLYLAVLLGRVDIAKLLHQMSKTNSPSYSGPGGQNALHAAVNQGLYMTRMLLNWNKDLTKQADQNGSTPLHFAAVLPDLKAWKSTTPLIPVVEANPVQLYQPDSEGFYPIHLAASSGAKMAVTYFIKERPEIAGFRDSKGRTFLHVAAERDEWIIVALACSTPSLAWILNFQDNAGNTAMHVAVQHVHISSFCCLLGNREVNLTIPNHEGQTPLDVSRSNIPRGTFYVANPEMTMFGALRECGANTGRRRDHFLEQRQKQENKEKESENLTNSTQTLGIGSVLIVTVTFGAIYAIPGGYKGDDHYNGGTPILAGRHIFNAFIVANTMAFILSGLATISLMYAGVPMISLPVRRLHLNLSVWLAMGSVASLGVTFTLGMFLVLAPVARWTAAAICVMMVIACLCALGLATQCFYAFNFASAVCHRKGGLRWFRGWPRPK